MKKALILIGAPGYNRGSEILLLGTLKILNMTQQYQTDISTFAVREQWAEENKELYGEIIPRETPYSTYWYKICNNIGWRLIKKTGWNSISAWFIRRFLIEKFQDYDLLVFVGADNFDYRTSEPNELNMLIDLAKKNRRTKILLFDCSMEAVNINNFFLKNLKNADVVSARDSLSYKNMLKFRSDIKYHADPAFIVEPKVCTGYTCLDNEIIGINTSPLVQKINPKVQDNIVNLIRWILEKTEHQVLLISHVMKGQDYDELKKIKQIYEREERVILLEDNKYSARELKYIISQCKIFVGARTHAVIAAYSSCVPALALGYSIKSRGIAEDIMGEKTYCIQVEALEKEDTLLKLFQELYRREKEVRSHLLSVMPDYKKTLEVIGDLI